MSEMEESLEGIEDEYWEEIKKDCEQATEEQRDYVSEWHDAGYLFTLNRILSNRVGGYKKPPY